MKYLNYLIVIALLAIFSCEKEPVELEDSSINFKKMLNYLATTGIDPGEIEIEGEAFMIDGDIEITFAMVEEMMAEGNLKSAEQYKYPSPYYCSQNNVKNVSVFIKSGVPSGWRNNTINAMNAWNGLSGTKIRFTTASSQSSANIVVKSQYSNDTWVAKANPPRNGNVNSTITVNTKYNHYNGSKKKNTMAHELGHTIGFAHTNGKSNFCTPKHIQGTKTGQESNSVMYRYTHSWKGFTNNDKLAAQIVYPN